MKYGLGILALSPIVTGADACSFSAQSDEEIFAKAKSIFRARITETRLSTLRDTSDPQKFNEVIEARFELKEIIKGIPPPSGIVRDMPFSPGNCGSVLLPGIEYVLIPGEHDLVWLPSASFPLGPTGFGAEEKLKKFRSLAKSKL